MRSDSIEPCNIDPTKYTVVSRAIQNCMSPPPPSLPVNLNLHIELTVTTATIPSHFLLHSNIIQNNMLMFTAVPDSPPFSKHLTA